MSEDKTPPPAAMRPSDPEDAEAWGARNRTHWSGGVPEERVSLVVRDGQVNFRCLAEECPTPCCGPFEGLDSKLVPCFVSSFSDLYLLPDDVQRVLRGGRGDLLEPWRGGFRLKLQADSSCAAFHDGLCTIHELRPAVCRAFPFDFDVFAGLVMIGKCPGVNAGWSTADEVKDAVTALSAVYSHWSEFSLHALLEAGATGDDPSQAPSAAGADE